MGKTNKLKLGDARTLLLILDGECVASSKLSFRLANEMVHENLLFPIIHGSRRSYRTDCAEDCKIWLFQQYGINDLSTWIQCHETSRPISRAEQVLTTGDSKSMQTRTFRGFLINVCEPLNVQMNNEHFTLHPHNGMAHYVEDFENFKIAEDVCVVGIENGENFQNLMLQRHLFTAPKILFVSRYPQSTDLRTWLQNIPNRYIHFGDFDLAGIHIFLHEYYEFLGNRAEFFIPSDIEERLSYGNRNLYNQQFSKFKDREISDSRLLPLVHLIHHYGRAYEQEGYIGYTHHDSLQEL